MLGISLVEAEKDHIRSHSLGFMLLSAGSFTNYIIELGKGLDYSIFFLIVQGRQNEEFTDQTFNNFGSLRVDLQYDIVYYSVKGDDPHRIVCGSPRFAGVVCGDKNPGPEGDVTIFIYHSGTGKLCGKELTWQ